MDDPASRLEHLAQHISDINLSGSARAQVGTFTSTVNDSGVRIDNSRSTKIFGDKVIYNITYNDPSANPPGARQAEVGAVLPHDNPALAGKTEGARSKINQPCRILPFPRNRKFVGRQTILRQIKHLLSGEGDCQKLALVGLGGIGKTSLANEFAHIIKKEWKDCAIFWVPALSMESFERAYFDIARQVGIALRPDEDVKWRVKHHLDNDFDGQWLFILDNADDEDLLVGSSTSDASFRAIDEFLPESDEGRVMLVTTRSRKVAVVLQCEQLLDVDALSEQEAIQLLGGFHLQATSEHEAVLYAELAQQLTYLPLAISQAAAFMTSKRLSVSDYLRLYQSTEQDKRLLLSASLHDRSRYKGAANAVLTTWTLSFQEIQKSEPDAAGLLLLMSQVEPEAIPIKMLSPLDPETRIEVAIATLRAYAFVTLSTDRLTVDIHPLVHMAAADWSQTIQQGPELRSKMMHHLAQIFPDCEPGTNYLWRPLLPHALRLLRIDGMAEGVDSSAICLAIGKALREDGQAQEALEWICRCLKWREANLPEHDLDFLKAQYELACTMNDARVPDKALSILTKILGTRKKVVPPDHPHQLESLHELATTYVLLERYDEGINILNSTTATSERVFGEAHVDHLTAQRMLASAYIHNGQSDRAIPILEHSIAIRSDVPPDDYYLVGLRYYLARAYNEVGRQGEGLELMRQVLDARKNTLPENHHNVLTAQHELANALSAAGQQAAAVELMEHVVAVQARNYPADYRERLVSQHCLAVMYGEQGRTSEAASLLEHVVAIQETALPNEGSERRLASQLALAWAYAEDGQRGRAINLRERLASVYERVLPETHEDRLLNLYQLARLCTAEEARLPRALQLLEGLEGASLEADHPFAARGGRVRGFAADVRARLSSLQPS